ncbi:MAG: Fe3+/spermidine/putrescine ABC transporter ATP-binding protein [Rhizobiales bacterium 65-9]|nr:ABC transporter ATP-binding protein [Hyphomicrobiales bacterium]OJY37632.1 MAG: Fe3+/spermidine/putrescine ABC transporter ATP-binding protein [Rhizobiales bacterium 65-9]
MTEAAIEVAGLTAGYGRTTVLHGVDLSVRRGEFIAMLGSSGCGKTTLLRTIAGFQQGFVGAIRLFGKDVAPLPPEKRGLAMVFQSYALWPHMTVLGNVGYGLKLRGVSREDIRKRVGAVLAMLNLAGLEERKVTDLSGGQRQRVALGRALAIEPDVLLLDEPLSNLDAKVRLQLRDEIKSLQKKLGFTALHVTHDREEAMTMADRIVVMNAGRIAQLGAPEEVYDKPASPFIATFMGADNRLDLDIRRAGDGHDLITPAGTLHARGERGWPDGPATVYFRDSAASIVAPDARDADALVLPAAITHRSYPGGHYRYGVEAAGRQFTVTDGDYHEQGSSIGLKLPFSAMHVFSRTDHQQGG